MSFKKKPKKELPEWKKDLFSHWESKPSRADRAEFPRGVIKQLIERAGGRCEVCKQREDTETHHIRPRARNGRGVLLNGLRVCHECHQLIQTNEDELSYWMSEWERRYGEHFYFDEQDHEEFNCKQFAEREAEEARKQRMISLEPIVELLSTAAGRKLRVAELRLIEALDARQTLILAQLLQDVVGGLSPTRDSKSYAYGERFDD